MRLCLIFGVLGLFKILPLFSFSTKGGSEVGIQCLAQRHLKKKGHLAFVVCSLLSSNI